MDSRVEVGKIKCLDKGYVRLVDYMGSDLSTVNAARVSFDKESLELEDKDERLINFLARDAHSSPFRHAILSFEVYAPLIVKNQWIKYLIGSDHEEQGAEKSYRDPIFAWNESSRRYITEEPEFYIPGSGQWRTAAANKKQGSGECIPSEDGIKLTATLEHHIHDGLSRYNTALEQGIAPEQARCFLPAYAMYIRWRWTASLQGVLHFLTQRTAHDAQKEIQEYARAIKRLTEEKFPICTKAVLSV